MKNLRFSILGTGMIAAYHQAAIEANAHLGASVASICHYDPQRYAALSKAFNVPCTSYEEVLSDPDIDAICICTPSGQHADQAVAAAKAGKHIFVEKPMALLESDCDRMIEAAEKNNVKLAVSLQRRAEPVFRRVRSAIEAGDLGQLTLGIVTMPYYRDMAYYNQAAWRGTWALDGGGVLMNQGIHIIDLLIWFMGDPVAIKAHAGTLHRDIEVEDIAGAFLTFEGGATATIAATTTAAEGYPHRIEIYGTGGGIQMEGEDVIRWNLVHPTPASIPPFEAVSKADTGAAADPRGITADAHAYLMKDFIASIRNNTSPIIDGREGKRSLSVVNDIYRAAGILEST